MSASSPPALVLAALAALVDSSPGRFSLDDPSDPADGPVVMAAVMGAGAAGAVYLAERGSEFFAAADADDPLSRSSERVGAAS